MTSSSSTLQSLTKCGQPRAPRIAVIIPACDEETCIGPVLEELLGLLDPATHVVGVGVNGSSDRTAEIARRYPVVVTETADRGYGFGCQRVIDSLTRECPSVEAYVFFAADGASDSTDVPALVAAYDQGYAMVLGARTATRANWAAMSLPHVLANRCLGLWCTLLTGRRFTDLAPHRLIDRVLFETIAPREMTFGWTIEAQIVAARLHAQILEIPARERRRIAGRQKVSGVTWRRTFSIGCRIVAAGWRTHRRWRARLHLHTAVDPAVELHSVGADRA